MIIPVYGVPVSLAINWILSQHSSEGVGAWADLCCGNGRFTESIGIIPNEGVAVDISDHVPVLQKNFTFTHSTIQDWFLANTKKFNLITLFGCVEHFEKSESLAIIDRASSAAESVIIVTPNGFLEQDSQTDPDLSGNPWQWHRCGFSPKELEDAGWLVFAFKNYHLRPGRAQCSYDELCAIKSKNSARYKKIGRAIIWKSFIYNLNPLHLYRTLRQAYYHRLVRYPLQKGSV